MSPKPFESWIQDLVYNVDVGIGLRLIKILLYLLFVLLVLVIYTASQFKGLKDPEAMDVAQLGRNLATQGKLITQYIRPASLWYLLKNKPALRTGPPELPLENHPDILHPPVYPAVLATVFKVFKPSFEVDNMPGTFVFPADRWIMAVAHLFTLLTGLMVYLLGRRLFDQRVALLGATVYFLSDTVWRRSLVGDAVPAATFFVTAALYFALRAAQDQEQPKSMTSGLGPLLLSLAFSSLSVLTRYGTVIIVPAIVLLVGLTFKKQPWVWAAGFLVAFLLLQSPWLIRNVNVSGGPLGLAPYIALNDSNMFEENTFEHTFAHKLDGHAVFRTLQSKCLGNLGRFYDQGLRSLGNGILACLFLTTFFFRFVRRDVHLFRWCVALSLILFSLVAGYFGEPTLNLLHVFLPVAILYGLAFFFLLLDRLQLPFRILNLLVIVVMVTWSSASLITTLLPPWEGLPYPPYFPPVINRVTRMLNPNELMCSDMAWATAWYGQRNSLLLPLTLEEFYDISDYHKRISGLYFTTVTRDKPYIRTLATGPYRTWFPILEGRIPSDFPLTQGFPINNLDQLFLTDRIRWGPGRRQIGP